MVVALVKSAYDSNGNVVHEPGVPYFPAIQVGTTVLEAVTSQGGHEQGRIQMRGVGDDVHPELWMIGSPNFVGPGVQAQIGIITYGRPGVPESQQRLALEVVRQSNNPDGSQGLDVANLVLDSHMNSGSMPLFIQTGSKTVRRPDGSYYETPERVALQVSDDGSVDVRGFDAKGKEISRHTLSQMGDELRELKPRLK